MVGAAALALALTACAGSSAPAAGTAHDPVATIGLTGEPTNFDLTTTSGAAIPQVLLNNVYETLVSLDQDGEIVPQLATAWTVSDDGLTYDFTLHEGVTFSSGAEFTADDVKFSLERVKTNWTINQGKMALLDHVEVVSPTEAKVVLTKPSNSWLYNMAGTVGIMFDTDGVADLANTPVGTGPFTITERVQGDHISLAARDDYWGEAPQMKDITLRYFADATASTNALRAGDVDMLYNMQAPDLVSQFETDSAFQVLQGTSNGEILLGLNNQAAPFDDERVRQAIAYGIDRQAVLDAAWAGYGQLIGAMVPRPTRTTKTSTTCTPTTPTRRASCSPRPERKTSRSRSRCPRVPTPRRSPRSSSRSSPRSASPRRSRPSSSRPSGSTRCSRRTTTR